MRMRLCNKLAMKWGTDCHVTAGSDFQNNIQPECSGRASFVAVAVGFSGSGLF